MRCGIVRGVLALAACLPALALAQQEPAAAGMPAAGTDRGGSWELSVGAGGAYLDRTLAGWVRVTNASASRVALGGVVRLGYNFSDQWGLSIGTGVGYTSPATVIQPFAALTWTPNLNSRTSPFVTIGGGESYTRWSDSGRSYRITGLGGHFGVGIRQMLSEKLALRVEAREQYEHYGKGSIPNAVFNGIGTVGLSWFFGGGRPKDTDGDGVPDMLDRCPNTLPGAMVDALGCPIDSDNDGVPDGLDQCPNTPSGVRVDTSGCPIDSDRDGVPDYLDRCRDTPSGVSVDSDGCPMDGDGDGVPDYLDRCPNTPANARPVDANGCPVDSDRDGVPDYLDRCPNTPANTPVDATGCPVRAAAPPPVVRVDTSGGLAQLPAVNATLVLRNVNFRPNRAELMPAAMAELESVASAMKATPNSLWEVGGYTSSFGTAARNLRLSQQRAAAVKRYLVSLGVDPASLFAVGYGARNPIASNRTAAGRRENMRVEIKRRQ